MSVGGPPEPGLLARLKRTVRRLLGGEGRARIYARIGRVESRVVELQIQQARRAAEAQARLDAMNAELGAKADALLHEQRVLATRLSGVVQSQTDQVNSAISAAAAQVHDAVQSGQVVTGKALDRVALALSGVDGRLERLNEGAAEQQAASGRVAEAVEGLGSGLARTRDAIDAGREQGRADARNLSDQLDAAGRALADARRDAADHLSAITSSMTALMAQVRDLEQLLADASRHDEPSDFLRAFEPFPNEVRSRFDSLEDAARTRHSDLASTLLTTRQFGLSLSEAFDGLAMRVRNDEEFAALQHGIEAQTSRLREGAERLRDIELMSARRSEPRQWPPPFELSTDFPLALESDDHRHPRGVANDNTRSPRFVAACERLFGRPLRHLDLGCAGGGLVREFLISGHRSMGLEGSDFALRGQLGEWRVLGAHLKTCDITKPFSIADAGVNAAFDVITAWEVLEHLSARDLPTFLSNVRTHLAPEGMFVASVATFEDRNDEIGAVWHRTVRPQAWWIEQVAASGLKVVTSPFAVKDYVRGSGSSTDDWNVATDPQLGFHLVATS